MRHLAYLWGFTVRLETQREDGSVELSYETSNEKRQARR